MNDINKVITAYGEVLEKLPPDEVLHPTSKLPYPKEVIEQCLVSAMRKVKDKERRDQLMAGLTFLNDFIPDEKLPEDPLERMMLFAKLNNE